MIVSSPGFIGPYSTLDAHGGAIKIGTGSAILDNASIVANPTHPHTAPAPVVRIGDQVLISYGARVQGPATIGAYSSTAAPVEIGSGAVVDGATIEPGSIVSALARVGPGVTLPSGYAVLPGKNVTTNAGGFRSRAGQGRQGHLGGPRDRHQAARQQSQPGGRVQPALPGPIEHRARAPGVDPTVTGINNGNLSAVEGASQQPGSATASTAYLPPGTGPKFPSPHRGLVPGNLYGLRARVTGATNFHSRAATIAHSVGRANSIRADHGQPITIGSIGGTGNGVTINSPGRGQLTIGQNFVAGNAAVLLGGTSSAKAVIGDNVSIGNGAVVDQSSLGSGSTVGDRAYLLNSTFPAGTNIPAGAIYINNKLAGSVEW